jgi:hypothetical protein
MSTSFLAQPHPYERSLIRRLKRAFAVGLFITLFLGIFKPFGLSEAPMVWSWAAGYGLVTFLAMSAIDIFLVARRIDPEKWTLGHELFYSALNILLIGILNALFSIWSGIAPWSWVTFLSFTLYTVAIGIFPVTAIVLIRFQGQRTHYAKEAEVIERELTDAPARKDEPVGKQIVLSGENQNERFEIDAWRLFYLKASDNYVEAFHGIDGTDRKVLRGSLRSFEDQLKDHPQFYRCHKSYVVNMDLVERVSGNAQGLRLHLKGGVAEVPVSRSLTNQMRERLSVHPGGVSHSPLAVPADPKG